jgi:hypothetical protein
LLEVAQRDNAELVAAASGSTSSSGEGGREQAHRDAMQAIDINHEEEVRRVHADKDGVIAELRERHRRLREPPEKPTQAAPQVVAVPAPELPAPPASVMRKREANLVERWWTMKTRTSTPLELLAEGDEAIVGPHGLPGDRRGRSPARPQVTQSRVNAPGEDSC